MNVGRTTKDEILKAFVDRLCAEVPDLNESNCFLTDMPLVGLKLAGKVITTVSPSGGSFPAAMFTGGGYATLTEEGAVLVTPIIRSHLDKPSELTEAMVGEEEGAVSYWQRTIMRAILVQQLDDGQYIEWRPMAKGRVLTRQAITPISVTEPRVVEKASETDQTWIGLTITFGVMFDWQL